MARTDRELVIVVVDTDAGGDQAFPLFRAPAACTVKSAYVFQTDDVNQTDANYYKLCLFNGGTAGTATTVLAGTIGGTAGTPGWTGLKAETFTVSAGSLTAGQVVVLHYDEEGTITPGVPIVVQLEVEYS